MLSVVPPIEKQQAIPEEALAFLREDRALSEAEDRALAYSLGISFATAKVHGRARQLARVSLLDMSDARNRLEGVMMVAIALLGDDRAGFRDMRMAMEEALDEDFPTLAKLEGFVSGVSEVFKQI